MTWAPDVVASLDAAPTPAEIAELLPHARAARDDLLAQGRPVTRDTLAARLRADGYPMRNARVSMLLHALREDDEAGGTVEVDDADAMIG